MTSSRWLQSHASAYSHALCDFFVDSIFRDNNCSVEGRRALYMKEQRIIVLEVDHGEKIHENKQTFSQGC